MSDKKSTVIFHNLSPLFLLLSPVPHLPEQPGSRQSEAVLLEDGRNGYYGINNRYSALYTFDDPYTLGDVNQDGVVSVEDARLALQYYASTAVSLDFRLHPQIVTHNAGVSAADIDGDGLVTVQDATAILSYYAQQASGAEPSWEQVLLGETNF